MKHTVFSILNVLINDSFRKWTNRIPVTHWYWHALAPSIKIKVTKYLTKGGRKLIYFIIFYLIMLLQCKAFEKDYTKHLTCIWIFFWNLFNVHWSNFYKIKLFLKTNPMFSIMLNFYHQINVTFSLVLKLNTIPGKLSETTLIHTRFD